MCPSHDRIKVVSATARVSKNTLPNDMQFVDPGDVVTYHVDPVLHGTRSQTTTASLDDAI